MEQLAKNIEEVSNYQKTSENAMEERLQSYVDNAVYKKDRDLEVLFTTFKEENRQLSDRLNSQSLLVESLENKVLAQQVN